MSTARGGAALASAWGVVRMASGGTGIGVGKAERGRPPPGGTGIGAGKAERGRPAGRPDASLSARAPRARHDGDVSSEDLENYETEAELALYREYRDVVGLFRYVVETERRFYLANKVDLQVKSSGTDIYFEVVMADAWVWDVYRSARLVKNVRVVTFRDVNIEELAHDDDSIPDLRQLRGR